MFDPYIVGVWLGDGGSAGSRISNQDARILHYLRQELKKHNLNLVYSSQYDYIIVSDTKIKNNKFLQSLQHYNLINNKHIPNDYKINNRTTRLQILAGLLDTDGYYYQNCFEIIQKSKLLSDDILFLARSLGFAAYQKACNKSCQYKGEIITGQYYRICISGSGLEEIPVKCLRKKAHTRLQAKDALVTGIKVVPKGRGNYYGFTLDGNNRYLLGDFTVTHNTQLVKEGICKALGIPFGFIPLGGISDGSYLVGHSYTYEGAKHGKIADILINTKFLNTILFFDELDKVSETKYGEEIINTLIHITDSTQNRYFRDKYFSEVDIDLSRSLIVFSYNDATLINPILRDRMVTIKTGTYSSQDKIVIARNYLIPEILEQFIFSKDNVDFSDEMLKYIIKKTTEEKGVRNLKRNLEKVYSVLNLKRILNEDTLTFPFKIQEKDIDTFLKGDIDKGNELHNFMYV